MIFKKDVIVILRTKMCAINTLSLSHSLSLYLSTLGISYTDASYKDDELVVLVRGQLYMKAMTLKMGVVIPNFLRTFLSISPFDQSLTNVLNLKV